MGFLGVLAALLGGGAVVGFSSSGGSSSNDDDDIVTSNEATLPKDTSVLLNDDSDITADDTTTDDDLVEDDTSDDDMSDTDLRHMLDDVDPDHFAYDPYTDTVTIDLDPDETRPLATFIHVGFDELQYVGLDDLQDEIPSAYEARYYLVPEGLDISALTQDEVEERYADEPDADNALAALVMSYGMVALGRVNLDPDDILIYDNLPSTSEQMQDALPTLETNLTNSAYYLQTHLIGAVDRFVAI